MLRKTQKRQGLPEGFVRQMQDQLGIEWPDFLASLEDRVPISVLLNSEKAFRPEFEYEAEVPWCPHGRYLSERPSFTLDPLFHAGCYYVMEASSMLLWEALTQLDLHTRPVRVLDLCAAPGGKSAVLLSRLHPDSCLVANEVSAKRSNALRHNLAKWGRSNMVSSQLDPSRIADSGFFDCVMVDAPCSGEGLFRKSPEAATHWSPDHVRHCSIRQQRILKEAVRLLRPGGVLIYSTCTYNVEENIQQIARLSDTFGMTSVPLNLPSEYGVTEVRKGDEFGYQCYPYRVRGEGFFIAAMRNADDAPVFRPARRNDMLKPVAAGQWKDWIDDEGMTVVSPAPGLFRAITTTAFEMLCDTELLHRSRPGCLLGRIKGKDIVPDHMLALSATLSRDIPCVELSPEQGVSYLRRATPDGVDHPDPGWVIAAYGDHSIGWMKQTQGRLKNCLPVGLRVRM